MNQVVRVLLPIVFLAWGCVSCDGQQVEITTEPFSGLGHTGDQLWSWKGSPVSPWLCDAVTIEADKSLRLDMLIEKEQLTPYAVQVPRSSAGVGRVTNLPWEAVYHRARGVEKRVYLLPGGHFSIRNVSGEELTLDDLHRRIKKEGAVFLCPEQQVPSKLFLSMVNDDVLIIYSKIGKGTTVLR